MRTAFVIAALLACAGCKRTASPRPADSAETSPAAVRPPPTGQQPQPTPPPPNSLWLNLIAKETTWVLHSETAEAGEHVDRVEIKVTSLRRKGNVRIAELQWSFVGEGGRRPVNTTVPAMIIADGKNALIYESNTDLEGDSDDDFVKALATEPSHADPPVEYRRSEEWGTEWLKFHDTGKGKIACFEQGPPDEEDFVCEDTCYALLCYSQRDGIVGLTGTWAPGFDHFAAEGYKGLLP